MPRIKAKARYAVQLSFNMILALVDIDQDYIGPDSPRHNTHTRLALERRDLCPSGADKLSKKGKAYLEMALFEYARAKQMVGAPAKRKRAA